MQNVAFTVGLSLFAMLAVSAVELLIPLRLQRDKASARLAPNLALTLLTFAFGAVLNTGALIGLAYLQTLGWGLFNSWKLDTISATAFVVLVLDITFYAAHLAMHKLPALWRFHRVHHSDPAVDVTTTTRQHPGEHFVRYGFIALAAAVIGASPTAYAVYLTASALNGFLEHANWKLPQRLDTALSWVTTWPNMHKVHHARDAAFTDSNYGNLFSWWDRAFSTFTRSRNGAAVTYGLDGFDAAEQHTTFALLASPFTPERRVRPWRPAE